MRIISNSFNILYPASEEDWAREKTAIETAGRTAYKSQAGNERQTEAFIRRLADSRHDSVFEFGHVRVEFTLSRYLTHELVRHRHGSFVMESTRYCNYMKAGGSPSSVRRGCQNLYGITGRITVLTASGYI